MSEHTRDSLVGVVLAAGTGARLNNGCKPLMRVAGVSLLERAVRTLREAGVGRVVVVVGHAKELVERFVYERGLGVELVDNADFESGNGSSALVGGRLAGRRFLVTMADHIVEPAAVARVVACPARFAAAVDSEPRYCDVAEATKVRLERGRVVGLGRALERFDAVDAGMFVCGAELLSVAERALASGEGSWNAVKRRCLAEGHAVEAVDLQGAFWIDVDTRPEAWRAERLLVARAAAKRADGPVARSLNRRLSGPLSLRLVRVGVSPTAATIAGFLLTLASAAALALGSLWPLMLIAGGVLVQLASVADGVDGEIARASLRASPYGGFLDSVLDRTGDAAVLVGLAIAASRVDARLAPYFQPVPAGELVCRLNVVHLYLPTEVCGRDLLVGALHAEEHAAVVQGGEPGVGRLGGEAECDVEVDLGVHVGDRDHRKEPLEHAIEPESCRSPQGGVVAVLERRPAVVVGAAANDSVDVVTVENRREDREAEVPAGRIHSSVGALVEGVFERKPRAVSVPTTRPAGEGGRVPALAA
jgi:CDP-L-myo-inositol myo-inositolphosphotransferase